MERNPLSRNWEETRTSTKSGSSSKLKRRKRLKVTPAPAEKIAAADESERPEKPLQPPFPKPLENLAAHGREEAETKVKAEAVTISALAYTYQIRGRDYDVRFDIRSDWFQQKTG